MSTRLLRVLLCVVLSLTITTAFAQDNWIGPFGGNWNNNANWSLGLPNAGSDVLIYNPGNYDYVILDTSPTINSLTIGGVNTGYWKELYDNGVAQTLTINNALNVIGYSYLYLTGGTVVTAGADSYNSGNIELYNGSQVSITGNLTNDNYIYTGGGGSQVNVTGTFTNNSSFNLGGAGDSATFGSLVNNAYVQTYGTLNAISIVNNSSFNVYGGTVNTGTLTNNSSLYIAGGQH